MTASPLMCCVAGFVSEPLRTMRQACGHDGYFARWSRMCRFSCQTGPQDAKWALPGISGPLPTPNATIGSGWCLFPTTGRHSLLTHNSERWDTWGRVALSPHALSAPMTDATVTALPSLLRDGVRWRRARSQRSTAPNGCATNPARKAVLRPLGIAPFSDPAHMCQKPLVL